MFIHIRTKRMNEGWAVYLKIANNGRSSALKSLVLPSSLIRQHPQNDAAPSFTLLSCVPLGRRYRRDQRDGYVFPFGKSRGRGRPPKKPDRNDLQTVRPVDAPGSHRRHSIVAYSPATESEKDRSIKRLPINGWRRTSGEQTPMQSDRRRVDTVCQAIVSPTYALGIRSAELDLEANICIILRRNNKLQ